MTFKRSIVLAMAQHGDNHLQNVNDEGTAPLAWSAITAWRGACTLDSARGAYAKQAPVEQVRDIPRAAGCKTPCTKQRIAIRQRSTSGRQRRHPSYRFIVARIRSTAVEQAPDSTVRYTDATRVGSLEG